MTAAREGTPAVPVFVSPRHLPRIQAAFPYLMPDNAPAVARFTAKLDWVQIEDFAPFELPGGRPGQQDAAAASQRVVEVPTRGLS